ncbi:hypothetical protein BD324DRAFT_666094 [Kockovaella imperatae]|uniref:C2H2-type domain-containing protein n=1 Tax=Kockovaella imperatae TaxID=4999 RepID=A0A1Y1U751_9TREE|nr:hypothetical protein BD324DRAFT_666094 [Kockovaella imperatae]ORX33851.1 hypothetical protein BD324DRAFT_666094 [Kockovaella imperatae]
MSPSNLLYVEEVNFAHSSISQRARIPQPLFDNINLHYPSCHSIMSEYICPVRLCKKEFMFLSKLRTHLFRSHDLAWEDGRKVDHASQVQKRKRGAKVEKGPTSMQTQKQRKKQKSTVPGGAPVPGTAYDSDIVPIIDMRTPSPSPAGVGIPQTPYDAPETPRPSQWAMTPDSSDTPSPRSSPDPVIQTPTSLLQQRVSGTSSKKFPTWAVRTPSPLPGKNRVVGAESARVISAGTIGEDTDFLDEDEECAGSPLDVLGGIFKTNDSDKDVDTDVGRDLLEQDDRTEGQASEVNSFLPGPGEESSITVTLTKVPADPSPVSVARSPLLGPAYDVFLPEHRKKSQPRKDDHLEESPSEDSVDQYMTGNEDHHGMGLEHGESGPASPKSSSLVPQTPSHSGRGSNHLPSPTSSQLIEQLLQTPLVSASAPQAMPDLCPCLILKMIHRLTAQACGKCHCQAHSDNFSCK